MTWTRLLEAFFLPPASLIWLAVGGLLLLPWRRGLGRWLLSVSVAVLYLLSTPLVEGLLLRSLDRYPPLALDGAEARAEAIVVLGAGRRRGALEYGGDVVSAHGLDRLRYGARLHRRLGLPIAVSGSVGTAMAETLEEDFAVPVRWIDAEGYNTHLSALHVPELLHPEGIRRIYLVSHYWHLPRAVAAFEARGFEVVPAPMGFFSARPAGPRLLVPNLRPLATSQAVFHELLGRLWYRLRYGYPLKSTIQASGARVSTT